MTKTYEITNFQFSTNINQEEPHSALPTAALLTNPIKNPLRRLASKSSIKMLFANEAVENKEAIPSGGVVTGVTAPYYPIFLPIDQDFKAKYIWHHRMAKRGKSMKERTYAFLEHPGGWLCFAYHFSV